MSEDDPAGRAGDDAPVRDLLGRERADAQAQLASLGRDFDVIVAASGEVATDDEHDPEGSTIAFERAQVSALQDLLRRRVDDLDAALADLAAGNYGTCSRCGEAISPQRLAARPAARTCISCAQASQR